MGVNKRILGTDMGHLHGSAKATRALASGAAAIAMIFLDTLPRAAQQVTAILAEKLLQLGPVQVRRASQSVEQQYRPWTVGEVCPFHCRLLNHYIL